MTRIHTLQDLANTLESQAAAGTPCPTDWECRVLDFRILDRIAGGLDHPVEHFDGLLPADWNVVPSETRTRIPGNPRRNHMRLRAQFTRAIAYHRPELDPWATLAVLAELDCGHHARAQNAGHAIRWIRSMALDGGLVAPGDITNTWVAESLGDVSAGKEQQLRSYFSFFVQLATNPVARQYNLLHPDLAMPLTRTQAAAKIELPDWLVQLHVGEKQRVRAGTEMIWRVILDRRIGPCDGIEDLLGLMEDGRLRFGAVEPPVRFVTWKGYVECVRAASLRRVPDSSRYSPRLQQVDTRRKPATTNRRKMRDRDKAQFRLFLEAIAQLGLPEEPEQLLSVETWPRIATAMTGLGTARGLSARTVSGYIDFASSALRAQATRPEANHLPRR